MRIFFFATEADIRPVLRRAEAEVPLKFIPTGITNSFARPIYLSSDNIPNVGVAKHDTGHTCGYLVSLQQVKNAIEKFRDDRGGWRWHLYNGNNPDTVLLYSGGLWKDNVLLDGGINTLHNTPIAERLMHLFLSSIQQERFTEYENWWFGPQAFMMWREGRRLTHSAQSPPEFDFKFPEELRRTSVKE